MAARSTEGEGKICGKLLEPFTFFSFSENGISMEIRRI
jgi:hypothetical protein